MCCGNTGSYEEWMEWKKPLVKEVEEDNKKFGKIWWETPRYDMSHKSFTEDMATDLDDWQAIIHVSKIT